MGHLFEHITERFTTRIVYGEPVTQGDVTIIPAASVAGGGGGGTTDESTDEQAAGDGAGFGLAARPVGAWIISDGTVRWQPSVDVTRIILGGQMLVATYLLVVRPFARRRKRKVST